MDFLESPALAPSQPAYQVQAVLNDASHLYTAVSVSGLYA